MYIFLFFLKFRFADQRVSDSKGDGWELYMKAFVPDWTEGWKQPLITCSIMHGASQLGEADILFLFLEMGKSQGQDEWF